MDLRPEEKFIRLSELSENPALKPFAHCCVQPAAPGLTKKQFKTNKLRTKIFKTNQLKTKFSR